MPPKVDSEINNALLDQKRLGAVIMDTAAATQITEDLHFTLDENETRLELLESYWTDFAAKDIILSRLAEQLSERTYFTSSHFSKVQSAYFTAKSWYIRQCRLHNAPQANNAISANTRDLQPVQQNQASLEKLKLPHFNGIQSEWESFKDKFASLVVDDVSMAPIIKFQRLVNCLQGEALQLVKGVKATAENFSTAWKLLCRQYDNRQLRFNCQMDALVALPDSKDESLQHLNSLLSTIDQSINVFSNLQRPVNHWDDIFVYFAVSKLPHSLKLLWAQQVGKDHPDDFPTLFEFRKFIEQRIQALITTQGSSEKSRPFKALHKNPTTGSESNKPKDNPRFKKSLQRSAHAALGKSNKDLSNRKCSYCNEGHFLGFCPKFSLCSQDQRWLHVKTANLCSNCLNSSHSLDACTSKGRCLVCEEKHHTKLHSAPSAPRIPAELPATASSTAHVTTLMAQSQRCKILATACVILQAPDGTSISVRALLDSGAEESFISERIAQALSLRKTPDNVMVKGVGGSTTAHARSRVSLLLKSAHDTNFTFSFSALVLKNVSSLASRPKVRLPPWPDLDQLQLADPHFGENARIDCILDTEVFAVILLPGLQRGPPGLTVTAINTVFGWVLKGGIPTPPSQSNVHTTTSIHLAVQESLESILSRFWDIEEVPTLPSPTPEENECYQHFLSTHHRNAEGRFVVRLPFISRPTMGDMRDIAGQQLKRLEKRFVRHPELQRPYLDFMTEYEQLQHMVRLSSDQVKSNQCCYLPHHPVFKRADSNKIRVVFNASQCNSNGISLNSFLHVGLKLQSDVLAIILRWSFFQYVFTCDIVKMFRQFLVHPDDQDWQRVLWRRSPEEPIDTFCLTTVTYGTASAPFLSNACMLQLAEDERDRYPEASRVIHQGRYADDFFAGANSLEDALMVQNQLVSALASAGLSAGKWASNRPELISGVDSSSRPSETLFQDPGSTSVLGIHWSPSADVFWFKVSSIQFSSVSPPTKRSISSDIAKLFDPIGWLTPIVIRGKILLQGLWLLKSDWDEPVPAHLADSWHEFRVHLVDLEAIRIPRWVGAISSASWQLHAFCDASERAYAGCLYMVFPLATSSAVKLLTAKSKVAPIKTISLPRLELSGALILARLVSYTISNIDHKPTHVYCWSDSQVVLSWLNSHPSRWKSFVANRVSEISSLVPQASWHHVRSAENPADLASRGVTPVQLLDSSLWWKGPSWLSQSSEFWPIQSTSHNTDLEARKVNQSQCFVALITDDFDQWLLRFSSLTKYINILSYIARWLLRVRFKGKREPSPSLSAQETQYGRRYLLKLVQRASFPREIQLLLQGKPLQSSSSLLKLTPFLDQDGLLRLGGRLQNSFLSENEIHPIILPARHYVTELFITQAQLMTLHGGPSLVQSHLLREFWIIQGRNTIRKIVRRCIICARYKARTMEQLMGPLPAVRVKPAHPFTYTGVDFAGPFAMRASAGRGHKTFKGYVAIFLCMVIKAVHIEIVSDLTSAAFLMAFRRFSARRGLCRVLFSDNATNFRGAATELCQLFQSASAVSQEVAAALAQDNVEWSFIPPRAPNFGGLWEANVKSFKRHLVRVIGDAKLTFEEFSSVATMIEACLNSRPLSAMSSDSEDLLALTPGHFLIGAPLISPPEPFIFNNENISPSSRWAHLVTMRNHFWKRWHKEFLTQLQQRSKWLFPHRSLQVGDLVLFKDQLIPPTKWPLARVTKLFPGPDGLCRVVDLRTSSSEFRRPVNQLIYLPVNSRATDSTVILDAETVGGTSST